MFRVFSSKVAWVFLFLCGKLQTPLKSPGTSWSTAKNPGHSAHANSLWQLSLHCVLNLQRATQTLWKADLWYSLSVAAAKSSKAQSHPFLLVFISLLWIHSVFKRHWLRPEHQLTHAWGCPRQNQYSSFCEYSPGTHWTSSRARCCRGHWEHDSEQES